MVVYYSLHRGSNHLSLFTGTSLVNIRKMQAKTVKDVLQKQIAKKFNEQFDMQSEIRAG